MENEQGVCPRLLGAVLRAQDSEGAVAVRLTEVEAYRGEEDPDPIPVCLVDGKPLQT